MKTGELLVAVGLGGLNVKTSTEFHAAVEQAKQEARRAILLRVQDSKGEVRYVALPLL